MMISKNIKSIMIFVALHIRISESLITDICDFDPQFLSAARFNKQRDTPILVSMESLWRVNSQIIRKLEYPLGFESIIYLYLDRDSCPVAKKYLEFEEKYPAVMIMFKNRIHDKVWYKDSDQSLEDFVESARNNKTVRDSIVTDYFEERITIEDRILTPEERDILNNQYRDAGLKRKKLWWWWNLD